MALEILAYGGFDQFDDRAQLPGSYVSSNFGLNTGTDGPFGDNCLTWGVGTLPTYSTYSWLCPLKSPIGVGDVVIGGMWVSFTSGSFGMIVMATKDSGGSGYWSGGIQITGTAVYRLTGSTYYSLASWSPPVDNLWHFVEAMLIIHGSAGEIALFMDGAEIGHWTGLDTYYGSDTEYASIVTGPGAYAKFGHYYFGVGSSKADRLGQIKCQILVPDTDTADEDWTLSAGSDSYALVDDFPPDDDTTYLESNTNGDMTGLGVSSLEAYTASVLAVRPIGFITSTDATDHTVRLNVKSGSTVENDANAVIPATGSYAYYQGDLIELDPDTAAAWTISGVNAAEVQVELTT